MQPLPPAARPTTAHSQGTAEDPLTTYALGSIRQHIAEAVGDTSAGVAGVDPTVESWLDAPGDIMSSLVVRATSTALRCTFGSPRMLPRDWDSTYYTG